MIPNGTDQSTLLRKTGLKSQQRAAPAIVEPSGVFNINIQFLIELAGLPSPTVAAQFLYHLFGLDSLHMTYFLESL